MYMYNIIWTSSQAHCYFRDPVKSYRTWGEYQYYITYAKNIFCDMCVCVCVCVCMFIKVSIYIDLVSTPKTAIVYTCHYSFIVHHISWKLYKSFFPMIRVYFIFVFYIRTLNRYLYPLSANWYYNIIILYKFNNWYLYLFKYDDFIWVCCESGCQW